MAECSRAAVVALDGGPWCPEHFILAAYRFLDEAAVQLRHMSQHGPATRELARRLDDCTRGTTTLAMAPGETNNLARARLIDILLWSAELLKQVRRGPRTGMEVSVVLAGSVAGIDWEEATKTQTVSRHGASLSCHRALAQGEVVKVTRLDTGQLGTARVVWSSRKDAGIFEVGLELLNEQNLWGLDLDVTQSTGDQAGSGAQAD
ncbi:MAG: hypothetical protein WA871_05755 [Candidatus Acidiferrales bacterium]